VIRIIPVIRILGGILIGVALLMTPPLAIDLATGVGGDSHFIPGLIISSFTGGTLLILTSGRQMADMNRRQAFLTTGLVWLVAPFFAAVPFLGKGYDFFDAYFETVSGLTTTGATVFSGLDTFTPAMLLWRSLMHWVGGIGIVVIGIIVMPILRIGGMQLFRTESSDQSDKVFGKGYELVLWIAGIYVGLTGLAFVGYAALGMPLFDALNHAMSVIATGGFSTKDASIGHFKSPQIEWATVLFMIAGALPFVAYIRAIRGRGRALFDDVQVQGFIHFLGGVALLLAVTQAIVSGRDFAEALRMSAFHVVSIVTTTGFVAEDYEKWGAFAAGAFFVLTFIGGCSGSTAGGIKVYRLQILLQLAHAHLKRLVSPSRAIVVTYSTRRVDDEVEIAILTFLVAMLVSTALITAVLSWLGLDLVTALSGAASALNNVGPGLGPVIGPAYNFSDLPDSALAVLSFAMILGRLEFFTLLVLLTPAFWRA
jgi:trk system potassium uptake protein TrkH